MGEAIAGLMLGGVAGVVLLFIVLIMQQFVYIARPNEVFIFSGRSNTLPDGTQVGYRLVHGGFALRIPILEKVDRMDLITMPIDIEVHNAYSAGGIPLSVSAIANVKVSSSPQIIANAVERFLGRDANEIRRVAKESLEGHIRGVVARMTPEEVNEDRLKFADEMVQEAGEDFDRLGLTLDTLKVQSVSDEVSYLDSIGRERLANVISTAEIAESTAKADAEEAQAEATRKGQVANEQAETVIRESENELREVKAQLEALAKSEEERAMQKAIAAKARAEQQLQSLRAQLAALQLTSERVLPAEAEQRAKEMAAQAEAARIAADGEALAEVLRLMTQTWLSAGEHAKQIFLIQQLELMLTRVSERVQALQVGRVTLLDGGTGDALPAHIAAMPATVAAVFRELKATTGIDVANLLTPQQGAS